MKHIFLKDDLPFLERFARKEATARDHWTLARYLQMERGYVPNESTQLLLLTTGAEGGDPWSMCELARYYFRQMGDVGLPLALRWWNRAAALRDRGALEDLKRLPILERIEGYRNGPRAYATMEMRCAMLTAWFLTGLGRDAWSALPIPVRTARIVALANHASTHLCIRPPKIVIRSDCSWKGKTADGLAFYKEHMIWIRGACLQDLHRLIQVLFHELGHFVVFSMWDGGNSAQQARFEIDSERIRSWHTNQMGIRVPTGEEDPDTLSYGVYTTWMLYFG